MYEERRNSFSMRDVILQVLLFVLLIFILVWLFPTKNYLKENNAINKDELYTNYITNMTEAAKDYFTTEKMPTEIGGSVKLTLNEMLKNKLLLEIGNNAVCDLEKSHVEVTKMDIDYQLRVELSCTDYSNYVVVTIGCKDFCTTCDSVVEDNKKPEETTKPTQQSTKKYTVTFDSNGGSAVSSQTVVSGKTATKPINPTRDGYTFVEWTLDGKTYNFNNAVKSDITLVAKWEKNVVVLYQYKKEISNNKPFYSNWSNWSSTKTYWGTTLPYANTDLKEYTVISTGIGETGETEKSCTTSTETKTVVVDTQKAVKKNVEGPFLHHLDSEYKWKLVGNINSNYALATYYKDGEISTSDNADTKYEFVEIATVSKDENCLTCLESTVWVYKKYVYTEEVVDVKSCPTGYKQVGSGDDMKCIKTTYSCSTYGKDYKLEGTSCVKYGTEEVKNNVCVDVPVKKSYVKYQYRTRTLENKNELSYVYEWSESKNDAKLIAAGYVLTGETKNK